MTLVYRSTVGRRLTVSEGDGNISELSGAAGISFLPSGTGGVQRAVNAKLADIVSTSDYDTAGHYQTARNALTPTIGVAALDVVGALSLTAPLAVASGGTGVGTLTGVVRGNGTSALTASSIVTADLPSNQTIAALVFIIDGGGAAPSTGVKGDLLIPFACTINSSTLQADASGSAVVDIWKKTYTLDSPPTVANTITASALPTLSSHQSAQDTTLTGWTTAIAANDMLRFNLNSVTTCQRITLTLKVTKT